MKAGIIKLCRANAEHTKRSGCALYCDLPGKKKGWRARWREKRMRRLRDTWKDLPAAQASLYEPLN
jgi:hypothetical protein